MSFRRETVRNGVYVELVRSLYKTLPPTAIMSIGFVLAFSMMAWMTADAVLGLCAVAGLLSSIARIAVLLRGGREAAAPDLQLNRARSLERRFAIAYFQFAAVLGVSAAYAFTLGQSPFHMLTVCLLVGYGAGAAAGVGLRPLIAIPSMMIAILPAIVIAAFRGDPIYWVTAGMMLALLAGGSQSLLARTAVTSLEIAKRLTFEELARHDVLTTLPNRLALREWFESYIQDADRHALIAVHCLDLNDFKPVNDQFGHPVGDSLLRAVAARLAKALRPGDIAARLGGDEFAVVQRNCGSPGEAAGLANRLRREIALPYSIEGHKIDASTSVGYALCPNSVADLDELLRLADQALYIAKNSGSGLECNDSLMPVEKLAA